MKLSACIASAVIGVSMAACVARHAAPPVVVQGAMDSEIRQLVAALDHPAEERVGGWTFWIGTLDGHDVVVSKTMKGMSNAAAATSISAERFHPAAIINQGTAGGHDPNLHVLDIVLGVEAVNLGSIKTAFRARGAGVKPEDWSPMDLLRSEGSAGTDPLAWSMRRWRADGDLLAAAHGARGSYTRGRVVDGVIGSADVWNSEVDRVLRFHEQFGTSAEEMETASVAQVAASFQIPFLGIRVLSNNVTDGEAYNRSAGEACQAFVREVVRAYFLRAKR